jgi:Protein of unknwon function (DUF3310)
VSNRDLLARFCDGTPLSSQQLDTLRDANLIGNDGEHWYVTTGGAILSGRTPPRFVADGASQCPDDDSYCPSGRPNRAAVEQAQEELNKHMRSALDVQIGGGHYKNLAIQPAEFIEKNSIPFLEGCVIKRMCRHGAKAGVEDLRKAKHEIDLILQLRYGVSE